MQDELRNRVAGVAVGAAVGDALGMPLEFGPPRPADRLVREMLPGRIPAGTFTDDTEMALVLAESLLTHRPLNPEDLAQRFVTWIESHPSDIGIHTASVLWHIADGEPWESATAAVQAHNPGSAGNGSLMRCWPVALAWWDDLDALLADSVLQSRVTHLHPECDAGSAFVNAVIFHLLHGLGMETAVARALNDADVSTPLRAMVEAAPGKSRHDLPNTGWVRHTLESVIWGLLTTDSFEDAVVNVVNLGNDADTAGAVVGALAGAAYGLDTIPQRWKTILHGEFPLGSGQRWRAKDLVVLAEQLARG
jgi:ADP-ribosyl-[dinitrogen reductase] hydrolase